MKPKVLLVANTSWYLYNFRKPLAVYLRHQGYEPVFVSPSDEYSEKLQEAGFRWIPWQVSRKGTHPIREFFGLLKLLQIYRREKPMVVHHFTVKCVLYGTISAIVCGVPAIMNAITGLGHLFLDRSLKVRLLRRGLQLGYRLIFKASRIRVIFQNSDDMKVFQQFGSLSSDHAILIRGSGVDIQRFSPKPQTISEGRPPVILFAGRLIREKGIRDFLEAARILGEEYSVAQSQSGCLVPKFLIAGSPDPGNPSSLTEADIDLWKRKMNIRFLGHVENLEEVIAQADVVVLPSYREGVPRVLLEAAAMEKALIATDVPGCRDLVEHGVNGLLVPVRNPSALADAIRTLMTNPQIRKQMGTRGREKVFSDFEESKVLQETYDVYKNHPGLEAVVT